MQFSLGVLKHSDYRKLYAAQVIALAGTGLTTIALALLAYELAGEAAGQVLGTALTLKMIAYIFIAPVISAIIPGQLRKQVLIALDVVRALCVLALPFVTEIWQIYLLMFVLNAASAGFTPTFQSVIPQLFEKDEDYTKALSLSRMAYDLENLLSPTIAALLLVFVSFESFFVANGVAFLISAVLVARATVPPLALDNVKDSLKRKLTQGFQIYIKTPRLRGVFALYFLVAFAGAMVIVNSVMLVREQLGLGESELAFAMAAFGSGSLIAAFLVPKLAQRFGDRRVMFAGAFVLLAGVLITALMFSGLSYMLLLLVWPFLGLGYSLVQTPAGRVFKRSANEEDLPKLLAAQFALSHACWLLAYPMAGFLPSALGMGATLYAFAGLSLLALIVAKLFWPKESYAPMTHRHDEVYHDHVHFHGDHHQHDHEGWEGPEPHTHPHKHDEIVHSHSFKIDRHHPVWPSHSAG
ncbi:putative MFS family arabinose efflux permease [Maritalea mobilis]|uniref:Putative MFS family arabinose efflux permease n=1 Tax=Maritalea mobilis TaxID=483324 RepID=A0A4R6VV68_9HYPH|nr:MFS transporter [Maritalea mobilis]TDQ66614.1 putative MFS family arabinose efflux permease [Maritalea mobilis]